MMVIVEQLVEWRLAGETEVLGENLPTTNPTGSDTGSNPGRRGGKPATNRLSYGATSVLLWIYKQISHLSLDIRQTLQIS
jgi:hypothetical protein